MDSRTCGTWLVMNTEADLWPAITLRTSSESTKLTVNTCRKFRIPRPPRPSAGEENGQVLRAKERGAVLGGRGHPPARYNGNPLLEEDNCLCSGIGGWWGEGEGCSQPVSPFDTSPCSVQAPFTPRLPEFFSRGRRGSQKAFAARLPVLSKRGGQALRVTVSRCFALPSKRLSSV
jgi:hypothetical protein